MHANTPPRLTMRGVRKTFGPVVALDNVDLTVARGEVLGLLGGNGAGKTTLMNVLFGLYKADAGSIELDGRPLAIPSPRAAIDHGIGMVHQHFLQVNDFTVLENIVLGADLPNRPTMRTGEAEARLRALSQQFGLDVDPHAPLGDLPMGVRQRVEILKALYRGVDVLILDEPTTMLTPQEVDRLFASLRGMVDTGMSVIFITHKLPEVLAACGRITVLRNGRTALTIDRAAATEEALVRAMVGTSLDVESSLLFTPEAFGDVLTATGDDVMLRVAGVTADDGGTPALHGCTFDLHEGEILGIAGVAGNGQRQLAEAILAIRPTTGGTIMFDGMDVGAMSTRRLLAHGLAYIPEDRWADGFLPKATVAQNLILGQQRTAQYTKGRFLDWRAIVQRTGRLIDEFNIKTEGPEANAGALSGGNIQRLMLARAFSRPVRLLVAHNPTQGLDIPSIEFIFTRILARKAEGMATLLISENLDELFLLCNRIAVLYAGRIIDVLTRDQYDKYLLGRLMSGAQATESADPAAAGGLP
ncbi:MAG: ABC transporter ATP-binding protein [Caldilineaceae bacterium]|nr:ABC transporter ATP-binding protein [Caldilineaceae bacterium]